MPGDRGRRGRGHGRRQNHVPDENVTRMRECEMLAIDDLFKSRFGVDTRDIPKGALPTALFNSATWQDAELAQVKAELNETKNKMDHMKLQTWNSLARNTNKTQRVVDKLRDVDAEMATVPWSKMYEALRRYPFFPSLRRTNQATTWVDTASGQVQNGALGALGVPPGAPEGSAQRTAATVHLCEAPGAFIAALNHYLKTFVPPLEWDWRALTLNPYFVGNDASAIMDDDALIVQTKMNWHYGADNSGDIRHASNIQSLWTASRDMFDSLGLSGAVLVTGDGSVDTQEHPNEQEASTASLLYAELVSALGLLAVGGSIFLKSFTAFEHSTFGLLYLCGVYFDVVDMYKPSTSKANNSETYITCRGFRGIAPAALETLLSHVGTDIYAERSLLPRSSLPPSFMRSVRDCGTFFAQRTKLAIERTLGYEGMGGDAMHMLKGVQAAVADKWIEKFGVRQLRPEHRLSPDIFLDGKDSRMDKQRRWDFKGTLEERRLQYEQLRKAQGQAPTRIIKEMQKSTVDCAPDDGAAAAKPVHPTAGSTDAGAPGSGNDTTAAAPGGRTHGAATGTAGGGVGPSAAAHRLGLKLAPGEDRRVPIFPDTEALGNQFIDDDGVGAIAAEEIELLWSSSRAEGLPNDVMLSKIVSLEAFLASKSARREARERLEASPARQQTGLCPHVGLCGAPGTVGALGPSFWTLAALDRMLGAAEPLLAASPTFVSPFLGAVQPHTHARALSLSASDASVLQYLAAAHADPAHAVRFSQLLCLESADAGAVRRGLPGLVQTVQLGAGAPRHEGFRPTEQLATCSVAASEAVARQVGEVDVVIGDLSALSPYIPPLQQMSVWGEYNRVARRKLVWDALTGLRCCKKGGSLLLRVGDLVTTFTAGLLYVLFVNFRSFQLLKPCTSCAASTDVFALFRERAVPAREGGDDGGDTSDSVAYLQQVLQEMEDIEALPLRPAAGEDGGRPVAELLCSAHITDIISPEIYCADANTGFLSYLQGRANQLYKRQARVLRTLLSKPDSAYDANGSELQGVVDLALETIFQDSGSHAVQPFSPKGADDHQAGQAEPATAAMDESHQAGQPAHEALDRTHTGATDPRARRRRNGHAEGVPSVRGKRVLAPKQEPEDAVEGVAEEAELGSDGGGVMGRDNEADGCLDVDDEDEDAGDGDVSEGPSSPVMSGRKRERSNAMVGEQSRQERRCGELIDPFRDTFVLYSEHVFKLCAQYGGWSDVDAFRAHVAGAVD